MKAVLAIAAFAAMLFFPGGPALAAEACIVRVVKAEARIVCNEHGQKTYDRSVLHLSFEMAEGIFFDEKTGRGVVMLARAIAQRKDTCAEPGKLTRCRDPRLVRDEAVFDRIIYFVAIRDGFRIAER